ncbi:Phosphoribosyltransferase domain-containing protein [Vibrio crassostreae]|nr:Phosphoribosyltransferase domain-containing protein [Vibrio crassostreae]
MGFDVDREAKLVTVDHSHNNFATTSVVGNPRTKLYSGLCVIGTIKRNKGANRTLKRENPREKIDGDNSPMLYALKNMDGLTTTPSDVRNLFRNVRVILDNELPTHGVAFEHIITIPSSHKLASVVSQVAMRACRRQGYQPSKLNSVLRKASGDDVKSQVSGLRIKSSDRSSMLNNIKKFIRQHGGQTDFQIKYIHKPELRKRVNLLSLTPGYTVDQRAVNILLVDDMVTTGSSLVAARDLVLQRYPNATIYAVCLFSAS